MAKLPFFLVQSSAFSLFYTIFRQVKGLFIVLPLFILVKEYKCANSTHSAREEEKNAELTDHIGNEGLACLGVPDESDAVIRNKVEEEIGYCKHTEAYYQSNERKLE